jgi:hypothetical protein
MEYQSVTFTAYVGATIVALLLTIVYALQRFARQKTWILAGASVSHSISLGIIAFSTTHLGNYQPLIYSLGFRSP